MLKIWKQAWKRGDSSRQAPVHDSEQEQNMARGPSIDTPSQDGVSAVPPIAENSIPSLTPPHAPSITENLPNQTLPGESQHENVDSIANHLPEITAESTTLAPATSFTHVNLEDQIIERAKTENTIVILPPDRAIVTFYTRYLDWAIKAKRGRGATRRVVGFIVNEPAGIELYASHFRVSEISVMTMESLPDKEHAIQSTALLQNDVLVITCDMLLTCIDRGYITISQFHSLVFQDVQHVRIHDSYSSIPIVKLMKEFYLDVRPPVKPRIFAVAIPAIERRFYFDSAMLRLEEALQATVFGVPDASRQEILALPDRPTEQIVLFDPLAKSQESRLLKNLLLLDPSGHVFRHHFRAARYTLHDLGACAADLAWRRASKEIEATAVPTYEEDEEEAQPQSGLTASQARWAIRDILKNWAFTMPNLDSSSRGFNVTPKFVRLVQVLKSCEPSKETFRGIIFVQRRATALAMVDLLRTLDEYVNFLRPYAVVGHGPTAHPLHQEEVFRGFATGRYNLLIATKYAEDLDIPRASIIIRFDLFESQISHAYVRARTRGRESHLVHMVERGNDAHRRILSQIIQLDHPMLRWTEILCKNPGSAVPPPSLRETINPYHSDSEDEEEDEASDFIKDPTTCGRIYLQDATTVIYRFASRHPSSAASDTTNLFLFSRADTEHAIKPHICTIHLPNSPLHGISSPASPSVAHARRAACYCACKHLSDIGLLDYRLFPLATRYLISEAQLPPTPPPGEDISTPGQGKGVALYPRKAPDFWRNVTAASTTSLYPTVIFSSSDDQPGLMVILTRQPLPQLPNFRLFLSGVPTEVKFQQGLKLDVDEGRLRDLHMYSIRICRAIANKRFTCLVNDMPYFLAPINPSWQRLNSGTGALHSVVEHIPWDLVSVAAETWCVALKADSVESLVADLQDAVIQDRWVEFTRRYEVLQVRPDLNPLTKAADSTREAKYENLVEYCKARRKGFEGLQNYDQPLIEVSKIPALLNRLNPASRPAAASVKQSAKYLIPELCAKFTIPASTLRTAYLLPSITRRIDDMLLVKELNARLFDHSISEQHLHIAVSPPSAGIEYDYERLELLGDAFLKYLSSVYVFVSNPTQKEGALHVVRQRIISNKALLLHASEAGVPPYIQSKPLTTRLWQPPNYTVIPFTRNPEDRKADDAMDVDDGDMDVDREVDDQTTPLPPAIPPSNEIVDIKMGGAGEDMMPQVPPAEASKDDANDDSMGKKKSKKKRQQDELTTQWLGDKAIADVAEAIIGAAYISGGREVALKVTKAMMLPVPNIDRWSDLSRKVLAPPPGVTARLRPGSLAAIEKIIGHKFHRPHLLAQALTHASSQVYESTSYERLEFIGDAILDFMVIRHIFDRDTTLTPGGLTLLKGAMVSNAALAAICIDSRLYEHLLFESSNLSLSIQGYADELKIKQAEEYAAAAQESRPPGQYWLEIEPPKALSDVIESIVGAIYLSDNFSPVGAEALFDNLLKPFLDKHITLKTLSHHPTKILFELFQAQGCQLFEITKEKEAGYFQSEVIVHDIVLSCATDPNVALASRRASVFALDALDGDPGFLTHTCDCRSIALSEKKKKKNKAAEARAKKENDDEDEDMVMLGPVSQVETGIEKIPEPEVEEGELPG